MSCGALCQYLLFIVRRDLRASSKRHEIPLTYLPRIEKYTSENWHLIGFVIFQLPANQTVLMVAPVLIVSVGALAVIQDLTAA